MSFESSPRRAVSGMPASAGSRSWNEWTQQLHAYVAWVNSQLRKKPDTKEVKDLRRELQDGTVLVELIEIVANEKIPGAHLKPSNSLEMKENVERVLQFMRSRKIKMHQIRSTDIVEGNMKSIMRLILALAAHFKPSSVKQSSQAKCSRTLGIAQEAASTLASIRQDAESIKRKMHRPPSLRETDKPSTSRKLGYPREDRLADSPSLDLTSSKSSLKKVSSKSSLDSESEDDVIIRCGSLLEDVQESQTVLIDETKVARNLLINLQNVLLNGEENLDEPLEISENSTHEQLVIYQARLQQTEEQCHKLKEELSRSKQECMQLQGMKQGLHQRLSEQQQEILEMKASKVRADMADNDEDEESLRDELTEKTTMLNRMHTELERREKTIAHVESELAAQASHSNEIVKSLEAQVKDLQEKLAEKQRKLEKLSDTSSTCTSLSGDSGSLSEKLTSKVEITASAELASAQAALEALKKGQPHNHPHLISLESALVSMAAHLKEANKLQSKPTAEVKGHRVFNRATTNPRVDSTKLLCFSSKSVTPSMKTVQKKLGEITLRDFKSVFPAGNEGPRLKYEFKSLDPEFGTVKEELTGDNDILPGWEGKVIGWIEEVS
ncbi:dixin-like [Watersipora subatra]|uniref:dixin-like n=1 Tax=Watersipora subatra TaxID=2589382 RepID=UPI00355AE839